MILVGVGGPMRLGKFVDLVSLAEFIVMVGLAGPLGLVSLEEFVDLVDLA